ncbi:hypothetical protein N7454_007356 [Penicillium verhagenii]|nr:hypothetical protein N7454_007356 [Penicillium verhagenii]
MDGLPDIGQLLQATRSTTFTEFLHTCHNLFSRPLVRSPSRSTTGKIPSPQGKYCPRQLRSWDDCASTQQRIYTAVRGYLSDFASGQAHRLFLNIAGLEGIASRLNQPLHSERALETYEELAVNGNVRNIIEELCKVPLARQEFQLGEGVSFESHTNSLENSISGPELPRSDNYCIHRIGGENTLLTMVEYKPPHKLTLAHLREGLRDMEFWQEVAQRETIPTDRAGKQQYDAERTVGAVLTQLYHAMICEGLEYSWISNGLALILLHIPSEDPGILEYLFCEPHMDIGEDEDFLQPKTAIARILCLTLMGSCSTIRDNLWRQSVKPRLPKWTSNFARTDIQSSEDEQETPTESVYTSSSFQPSSSPASSSRQTRIQRQTGCAPPQDIQQDPDPENSDSDPNQYPANRKRNLSQLGSSPPGHSSQSKQHRHRRNTPQQYKSRPFCSQNCLLGLQRNTALDPCCPNFYQHKGVKTDHQVTAQEFIRQLEQRLDEDIDQYCSPLGWCGASGAPFKITCPTYGYTMVGKGTTAQLWPQVSREAEVYHVLRKIQGSSVPVFLGAIDLGIPFFLHGAGEIRHMLLMAWGGKHMDCIGPPEQKQIRRSRKDLRSLGIRHGDIRLENLLWNAETQRVMIIDFHLSSLQPMLQSASKKRDVPSDASPARKRMRAK